MLWFCCGYVVIMLWLCYGYVVVMLWLSEETDIAPKIPKVSIPIVKIILWL